MDEDGKYCQVGEIVRICLCRGVDGMGNGWGALPYCVLG